MATRLALTVFLVLYCPIKASPWFEHEREVSQGTSHGTMPYGRADIGQHTPDEPTPGLVTGWTSRDWPNHPGVFEAAGGPWRNGRRYGSMLADADDRHSKERAALVKLFSSTGGGTSWVRGGCSWLATGMMDQGCGGWNTTRDHCQWWGVRCNSGGRVTELHLRGNGLTGHLPSGLQDLVSIRWLSFEQNAISGPIPASLGNLGMLRGLYLSGNRITGSIPSELGSLYNLTQLQLDNNRLSGSMPQQIGGSNMPLLSVLRLQRNRISGSITTSLPQLPALELCNFGHNALTGELPNNIGDMNATLRGFWVNNNSFSGVLPASIASLSTLESMDLYHNSFSGLIPSSIQNMPKLKRCDLRGNAFQCPVPAGIVIKKRCLHQVDCATATSGGQGSLNDDGNNAVGNAGTFRSQ